MAHLVRVEQTVILAPVDLLVKVVQAEQLERVAVVEQVA
jgi:hypothetical protein